MTTTPTGYGDLKNGQASDNYGYDAIGNLVKDESEGIASGGIEWTVYGKISQVTKTNSGVTTVIKYTYDATGNRIGKWVHVGAGTPRQTAYVRDASGDVMAIYEKGNTEINGGHLSQIEVPLYGSSRLGIWRAERDVEGENWELFETEAMLGTSNGLRQEQWSRGRTQFELSNHLGNVLATISDRKLPVVDEGVTICDDAYYFYCYNPVTHYTAEVLTANDYYPFGMGMPGRKYSEGEYRYGFNGKEEDPEVKGVGAQYDYGFRIYDPRLGRFLSTDPLSGEYPWYTPYQFAGNTPIQAIDLDGAEPQGYSLRNPYVASHPGSGVKFISSSYDGKVYDHRDLGIVTAYAIQDIDKKCYLIFESAMGSKQYWYREYDKNGWKGNVNSFEWQSPPDPSDVLTAATVGPLVLVPGLLIYGKAALIYLGEELVEEIVGFPIIPDPGDAAQDLIKRKLKREAAERASQKLAPDLDWDAVVPKKGKYAGEKRMDHVRRHNVDDVTKDLHGVFNGDGVDITNKAWSEAQRLGLKPDETGTLVVPYNNAGKQGGKAGNGQALNNVTIHVVAGTNQIITAYPSL